MKKVAILHRQNPTNYHTQLQKMWKVPEPSWLFDCCGRVTYSAKSYRSQVRFVPSIIDLSTSQAMLTRDPLPAHDDSLWSAKFLSTSVPSPSDIKFISRNSFHQSAPAFV